VQGPRSHPEAPGSSCDPRADRPRRHLALVGREEPWLADDAVGRHRLHGRRGPHRRRVVGQGPWSTTPAPSGKRSGRRGTAVCCCEPLDDVGRQHVIVGLEVVPRPVQRGSRRAAAADGHRRAARARVEIDRARVKIHGPSSAWWRPPATDDRCRSVFTNPCRLLYRQRRLHQGTPASPGCVAGRRADARSAGPNAAHRVKTCLERPGPKGRVCQRPPGLDDRPAGHRPRRRRRRVARASGQGDGDGRSGGGGDEVKPEAGPWLAKDRPHLPARHAGAG